MRLPRSRNLTLIIGSAVVGLSVVGTAFWWIIIPTWEQWEVSKSYQARSQNFAFGLSLASNLASNFADVRDQSERIPEIGESEFKHLFGAIESIKSLSFSGDLLEISRQSQETENICQNAWVKYEKLSDEEKIEWWENQGKRTQRISDYLSRMKRKYELAADRPGFPSRRPTTAGITAVSGLERHLTRILTSLRTRFTLRRLGFELAILAISFVLTGIGFTIYRSHQHRIWYRNVEKRIIQLAARKPADVSPNQWAYCLHWTWNLHGNYGAIESIGSDERAGFLEEFDRRLGGKVDLGTIDWFWDEYARHSRGGQSYSQNYRPTNPNNIRNWFTNQEEGYHLSEWLERLSQLPQNQGTPRK